MPELKQFYSEKYPASVRRRDREVGKKGPPWHRCHTQYHKWAVQNYGNVFSHSSGSGGYKSAISFLRTAEEGQSSWPVLQKLF